MTIGWGARNVAQDAGHPVSLHRVANGLRDDQPNLRHAGTVVLRSERVDDQIGLNGPDSPVHRLAEVRRPCHPVLGRKHFARPCLYSCRVTQ